MEAAAVDKLVDKANFASETALAIAEAMDIAIKAANLVTVPVLDARFAVVDARFTAVESKMDVRFAAAETRNERRFAAIEKSISAAKVWTVLLYVALVISGFTALAADHRYLVDRMDQLAARLDARMDRSDARQEAILQQISALNMAIAGMQRDLAHTQGKVESIEATLARRRQRSP